MKIKKIIFVILGCVSLALGTIGIFLPILPTVPFYLLTLFFFANSSQRLHRWFLGTRLYEKHLAPYIRDTREGDDRPDEGWHHRHRDSPDGIWLCHDDMEEDLDSMRDSPAGLACTYLLFSFPRKNNCCRRRIKERNRLSDAELPP